MATPKEGEPLLIRFSFGMAEEHTTSSTTQLCADRSRIGHGLEGKEDWFEYKKSSLVDVTDGGCVADVGIRKLLKGRATSWSFNGLAPH